MKDRQHVFRLFDKQKYSEIEPTLVKILDKSVNIDELEDLLRDAIDIANSEEFKENTDNESLYLDGFQEILDLICTNRFSKWKNIDESKIVWGTPREFIDPKDLATYLTLVLCCPHYQDFTYGRPISKATVEYHKYIGAFYSHRQEIFSILDDIGTDKLPVDSNLCIFNPQQFSAFSAFTKIFHLIIYVIKWLRICVKIARIILLPSVFFAK